MPVSYLASLRGVSRPQSIEELERLLKLEGEEEGWGTFLTGLEKVGQVLDTPASIIRRIIHGTVGGRPVEGRVYGEHTLEPLLGVNKPTGFVPLQDPEEFLKDVGRFGYEVATDPLSYLGIGGLTKVGKAARAASRQAGRKIARSGELWGVEKAEELFKSLGMEYPGKQRMFPAYRTLGEAFTSGQRGLTFGLGKAQLDIPLPFSKKLGFKFPGEEKVIKSLEDKFSTTIPQQLTEKEMRLFSKEWERYVKPGFSVREKGFAEDTKLALRELGIGTKDRDNLGIAVPVEFQRMMGGKKLETVGKVEEFVRRAGEHPLFGRRFTEDLESRAMVLHRMIGAKGITEKEVFFLRDELNQLLKGTEKARGEMLPIEKIVDNIKLNDKRYHDEAYKRGIPATVLKDMDIEFQIRRLANPGSRNKEKDFFKSLTLNYPSQKGREAPLKNISGGTWILNRLGSNPLYAGKNAILDQKQRIAGIRLFLEDTVPLGANLSDDLKHSLGAAAIDKVDEGVVIGQKELLGAFEKRIEELRVIRNADLDLQSRELTGFLERLSPHKEIDQFLRGDLMIQAGPAKSIDKFWDIDDLTLNDLPQRFRTPEILEELKGLRTTPLFNTNVETLLDINANQYARVSSNAGLIGHIMLHFGEDRAKFGRINSVNSTSLNTIIQSTRMAPHAEFIDQMMNKFDDVTNVRQIYRNNDLREIMERMGHDLEGLENWEVKDMMSKLDVDEVSRMAREMNISPSSSKFLRNFGLSNDRAAQVMKFTRAWMHPEELDDVITGVSSYINLFKTHVTSVFPAFILRNGVSGLWMSWIDDAFDIRNFGSSMKVAGWTEASMDYIIPGTEAISRTGKGVTKKEAIRELHGIGGIGGSVYEHLDQMRAGELQSDMLRELRPGETTGAPGSLQQLRRAVEGEYSLKPWQVRGVRERAETAFLPAKVGQNANTATENFLRIQHMITRMTKGDTLQEAAARAVNAHFNYTDLTRFEKRWMKNIFPFYTFFRKNVPYQLEQLAEHPGRITATMRAGQVIGGEEEALPEWIKEEFRVKRPDGVVTGMDIPFRDVGEIADLLTDPKRGLQQLGGRLAPPLKYLIERTTGQDIFLDAPIEELTRTDPITGRVLEAGGGARRVEEPKGGRYTEAGKPIGPTQPQFHADPWTLKFMSNILAPASRYQSTLAQFAGEKGGVASGVARLLTGVKSRDINAEVQEYFKLQQMVDKLMEQLKRGGYVKTGKFEYTPRVQKQAITGDIEELLQLTQSARRVQYPG